jgi:hypothetical protein
LLTVTPLGSRSMRSYRRPSGAAGENPNETRKASVVSSVQSLLELLLVLRTVVNQRAEPPFRISSSLSLIIESVRRSMT